MEPMLCAKSHKTVEKVNIWLVLGEASRFSPESAIQLFLFLAPDSHELLFVVGLASVRSD